MAGNIFSALTASVDCVVKYIKDFKNGKKGVYFALLSSPYPQIWFCQRFHPVIREFFFPSFARCLLIAFNRGRLL